MRLDFEDGCWYRDFEAVTDAPRSWVEAYEREYGHDGRCIQLRFKAYDTQGCNDGRERKLFVDGYSFDCEARVEYTTPSFWCEDLLGRIPAKSEPEARAVLEKMADAIFEGEE